MTSAQRQAATDSINTIGRTIQDLHGMASVHTADHGQSRETSLVLTKLDEARHWANDEWRRINKIVAQDTPAPAPVAQPQIAQPAPPAATPQQGASFE